MNRIGAGLRARDPGVTDFADTTTIRGAGEVDPAPDWAIARITLRKDNDETLGRSVTIPWGNLNVAVGPVTFEI